MKSPLHILHLEDDPNDAALIQATLDAGGIASVTTRVQNRDDFVAALEHGGYDLILSDFSLPAFDGLSAIQIVRAKQPELPVILVSGTLGEHLAVESLQSGATDYILKERLARLAPAVRRAMHEVEEHAERRRLETQLIDSQKMEVIGQLACGIAHDFNNLLGVIIGYSDLLAMDLDDENPLGNHVAEIRFAAKRAVGLTKQLLVFSRQEQVQLVELDLNETMNELEPLLHQLIDEKIVLTLAPGSDIGCIHTDSGYVGQLLMNLVVNARDAMPSGGRLVIATNNFTLDAEHPGGLESAPPGDYVTLSVSDTGVGISDQVKAHLFQPFFTTKAAGKGTGLGLATCKTIAEQSGGHIGLSSVLGEGTTFTIYFPRVDQPLPLPVQPIPSGALPRGTETLLVVEDEPSVRHLARSVLEGQGYTVLSASNGQAALRVVGEQKGSPIRLVVTDIVMPLMGGKVMAEWLHEMHPEIKVLFTSGYTEEIIRGGTIEAGVDFLPKPYSPATLVRKVREILARGHNAPPVAGEL